MDEVYTDPVHHALVRLSPLQRSVFVGLEHEIERLKHLRHLGLVACVLPTAYHTKFDHQIGVMYLLSLAEQLDGSGVPKLPRSKGETGANPGAPDAAAQDVGKSSKDAARYRKAVSLRSAFAIASAVYHIGHMPLSYSTERALARAAAHDAACKAAVLGYVEPLREVDCGCKQCGRDACAARDQDLVSMVEAVLQREDWRGLYRFFSVAKILGSDRVCGVVHNNDCMAEVLHLLTGPPRACAMYDELQRLDRLDYILRDLAYAARVRLDCNVAEMASDPGCLEWQFLDNCEARYLEGSVYNSPDVRIRRAVYERAAAAAFARRPGLIAELLSPASSLSCDVGWCRHCEKNLGLSGFFDPQYSEFRRYWRFSLHTPSAGQGLDSSVDFATRFSRRPRALAAVVLPPHDGEALVGVRSFEDPRHDDLVELLVRLGDVRRDYGLLAIPQQLTRPVAEYLVGTEAEVFSGTAPGVVGRHMLRAKVAVGLHKALEDELSARQSRRGITYGAVEVREQRDAIVGRPSGGFGELVWWWAEGALQSDSDDTALSAARWLAAVTVAAFDDLNWRRRRRVSVMLEQVIGSIGASIQEALSDGQEEPIGHLLEGLALLRVLLRHKGGAIYRWVIPNLRCKNTRTGQDDAEQDIVQVSLCAGGQVRVYMWGCGTGQDLAAKKKADIAKALSLADRIRTRFPHVTRSAVNYFEVADGQVVEDFEGHAAAVFPAT